MKIPRPSRVPRFSRGFTLPELLVVIAIVAMLATVALGMYRGQREKAEGVVCITKMKRLGAALAAYVVEYGTWPQEPQGDDISDEQLYAWWMAEMKQFNIQTQDWFSPAHLKRIAEQRKSDGKSAPTDEEMGKAEDLKIPSFVPTQFPYGPNEPYRYRMPWLAESGDAGGYVLMPDLTVIKQVYLSEMK